MITLDPILHAVRSAAAVAAQIRDRGMGAREKGAQDPVTLADYAAQAILCRAVAAAFPDDAIMGEERASVFDATLDTDGQAAVARYVGEAIGESVTIDQVRAWLESGRDRDPARQWLIDPIDGTKGYIAGRRYAIALALLTDGLPTVGIIGAPDPTARGGGLIFTGQRSAAYVQPLSGSGRADRVAVTQTIQTRAWRAVESADKSHGNFSRPTQVYQALGITPNNISGYDSQVKYAMIAGGDAELFLRFPRDSAWINLAWDHAPGVALLHAAGGVVTDLDGSLLDFTTGARMTANQGMVATNGVKHDTVLDAVAAVMRAHPTPADETTHPTSKG
ncbi:MAG: inositol monophosphatase family protein [Chloroflexota bacterium]|nr:inositol monophosphatase family protein [Chloroflexota bacterium]